MLKVRQSSANDVANMPVVKPMVHKLPRATGPYELEAAKNAQMLRNVGIAGSQDLGNFAGAQLLGEERMNNRESSGIGEGGKKGRRYVVRVRWRKARPRTSDLCRVDPAN